MKKLLFLLFILVIGWVAWPFFSMYQIYGGLKSANASVIEDKIDWPSLRESLKPTVSREVDKSIAMALKDAGPAASLVNQQLASFKPKIIDMAMKSVVTPEGLIKIAARGGDIGGNVGDIVGQQIGKLGGLGALMGGGGSGDNSGGSPLGGLGGLLGGGKGAGGLGALGGLLGGKAMEKMQKKMGKTMKKPEAPKTTSSAPMEETSYGLGNIKRFAFTSPFAMELGVAKDPGKDAPDVTAVMEFKNFSWKLTKLIPNF